ncbi:MAG: NAD-dependent epimerase/dehydratase family protein [Devosia nanyangense]|uniref:NAD-dependent epimerase/dehydratase family protein n=1 Tax=Devosia nanyangense TaxID=1228055 RepID=A0A933NY12_9HYPH|nr:NAD-dependent epimerase/dehydratase family protein [Devosia nanyangense]
MKILIVGGTGMIGGCAAVHLREQGNEVVLAARRPAAAGTPMATFDTLLGDYTEGGFSETQLSPFDAVVFAAGNDIRHLPRGADAAQFWDLTQINGVPAFVELARRAGVKRLVHIGSYYHQVQPDLIETNPYVRGRHLADVKARALATPDFNVSTLNPPSIVGVIPGQVSKRYETLLAWARGQRPDVPLFAPPGGTNYMSMRSLAEAIWGALQRAESGRAYLVGDENLSYRQYFQMLFDAVGNPQQVEERDAEHPLLTDAYIVQGRGNHLAYEPEPAETALLGYRRHDVRRAISEVVAYVEATEST